MNQRIAVIGAGIGGLMTALFLTQYGFRDVTIFEQGDRLGGRVRYRCDPSGRYRIDEGPTIILLPEMLLDLLKEAGVDTSRLELLPCDPLYRIYYENGEILDKFRDPAAMLEVIQRIMPEEAEGYKQFMRDMETAYRQGKPAFLEQAFPSKQDFLTWNNMKLMVRLRAFNTVRKVVAGYFNSSMLQDAYSLQTLYIGGVPHASPGLYTLLPYAEHAYGIWMLKGGYASLIDLLAEELERRGVQVKLKSKVQKLNIQEGQVKGIVVDDASISFDTVVYNGDYPMISQLLPKQNRMKRNYMPSTGCLLIYMGIEGRYESAKTHQFFLPEQLSKQLEQMMKSRILPDTPSFYTFYPTAVDAEAAPDGESVMYVLIPVPYDDESIDWEAESKRLVTNVIKRAEERSFPGLSSRIRWQEIRTPKEAAAEGLYQGGSFGIAPIWSQLGGFRPQPKPLPIKGLFAAGASIHPGGGVPIVMQGARLTAEMIQKECQEDANR